MAGDPANPVDPGAPATKKLNLVEKLMGKFTKPKPQEPEKNTKELLHESHML